LPPILARLVVAAMRPRDVRKTTVRLRRIIPLTQGESNAAHSVGATRRVALPHPCLRGAPPAPAGVARPFQVLWCHESCRSPKPPRSCHVSAEADLAPVPARNPTPDVGQACSLSYTTRGHVAVASMSQLDCADHTRYGDLSRSWPPSRRSRSRAGTTPPLDNLWNWEYNVPWYIMVLCTRCVSWGGESIPERTG
jgi:hypothetical protein